MVKPKVVKQIPLRIRRTEDREKKGSHGSWRNGFCSRYNGLLKKTRQDAFDALETSLSGEGKTISCQAGCTYCCYHYVAVSFAQGIVIVDYLYKRKELLKQFLDNYEEWRTDGEAIAGEIDRIRIDALSSSKPTQQIMVETRPLSNRYLESNIRCPFLVDDKCSIYEVRPLACSGHHSVSPPEYCAPASQQKPDIRNSVPNNENLVEIIRLAGSQAMLYELTLPVMVYRILTEGSTAIKARIAHYGLA